MKFQSDNPKISCHLVLMLPLFLQTVFFLPFSMPCSCGFVVVVVVVSESLIMCIWQRVRPSFLSPEPTGVRGQNLLWCLVFVSTVVFGFLETSSVRSETSSVRSETCSRAGLRPGRAQCVREPAALVKAHKCFAVPPRPPLVRREGWKGLGLGISLFPVT